MNGLRQSKRAALEHAMNDSIPLLARFSRESATTLAKQTLEDIQLGHNPDFETIFRQRMLELGIDLT